MRPRLSWQSGFTLVELVIAIGLAMLIIGMVMVSYNNFNADQKLKQTALTVKNDLRLAQAKAVAAEKPASGCTQLLGYQVSFTEGSYSLQALCSEGLVGNITSVSLPGGISFSPIPATLLFQVLTRTLASGGTVTIRLTGLNKNYRLEVSPTGDIGDLGFQ